MRYDSPGRRGRGVPALRRPGLPDAQAAPDRRRVGPGRARGRRPRRRADARHQLPVDPAGAIAMARALAPYRLFWLEEPVWPPEDYEGLARVARIHRHADRARRERVDGVRVPRDHRPSRRPDPAAEHHQGGRHLRDEEDRGARPGGGPHRRAALVLLRSRPRRHAARRGHLRRQRAHRVPHRRDGDAVPDPPHHRGRRLGGGADRPRPRRRGERGGHSPLSVRRRRRPSPSC